MFDLAAGRSEEFAAPPWTPVVGAGTGAAMVTTAPTSLPKDTEASWLLDRLARLANEVGLLFEEYDAAGGRMIGNFPRDLSHLALVRAVHRHDGAVHRATRTGGPDRSPKTPEAARALHR